MHLQVYMILSYIYRVTEQPRSVWEIVPIEQTFGLAVSSRIGRKCDPGSEESAAVLDQGSAREASVRTRPQTHTRSAERLQSRLISSVRF